MTLARRVGGKGQGCSGRRPPNHFYGREDSDDKVPLQPRLPGRGSGDGCVSEGVSGCADHFPQGEQPLGAQNKSSLKHGHPLVTCHSSENSYLRILVIEKDICKISSNSTSAFNSLSETYKKPRSREKKENCQLPRPSIGFSVLGV